MQLYTVPRNSKIKVVEDSITTPPDACAVSTGETLNFSHIDGMYSYCTRDNGDVVHLAAWTEVDMIITEEL